MRIKWYRKINTYENVTAQYNEVPPRAGTRLVCVHDWATGQCFHSWRRSLSCRWRTSSSQQWGWVRRVVDGGCLFMLWCSLVVFWVSVECTREKIYQLKISPVEVVLRCTKVPVCRRTSKNAPSLLQLPLFLQDAVGKPLRQSLSHFACEGRTTDKKQWK